ncbi:MAG: MotA/TolQ/ExbB proton channel family protein [Planctomycetota bacterium]|nr:MAG: MotA/TolQ/ExbB proton channel family protein [Planctomycetota bacterium]
METDLFSLFSRGGFLMYPILACSVIAVGIIAERILRLREASQGRARFLSELGDIFTSGFNPAAALNLCERSPGILPQLAKVAILNRDRSPEELREAVEAEAARLLPALHKNLTLLGVIAQITPLLGLLGTVVGMIDSFAAIQQASAAGQGIVGADVVAGGIWTALITTAAGLTVAIPVYVAYSFLDRWADAVAAELELASADIVRLMEGGSA